MAHASIQNSSFVNLLQQSLYHLSGDSEVSSCLLISLKPLKRRISYTASFRQVQLFSDSFSPFTHHIWQSCLRAQGLLLCWPGLLADPQLFVFVSTAHAQSVFAQYTPQGSSFPPDDFPFGCGETPALCWLFRPHHAYHPWSSLTCNVSHLLHVSHLVCVSHLLCVSHLHCRNQSTASVHGCSNTEFFACICFWCHFPLQRFFSLFHPVPVILSLWKHFLSSSLIFHSVAMAFSAAFELSTLILFAQVIPC